MDNEKLIKENIIKSKSFTFAVRIVKMSQYLIKEKQEFVLLKQILRSRTAFGALVRKLEHAERQLYP